MRTIYSNGADGLGQLLRRLQTTASAMHTGTRPDDEDSALIARLARGDQARVAYLSLNRGEGFETRRAAVDSYPQRLRTTIDTLIHRIA